jgi:hypothetical protein
MMLFGESSQFRMTNCVFQPTQTSTFKITGYIRGVVDHCTFDPSLGSVGVMCYVFHDTWGNVGSFGDNSWAQPHTMGTSQALFFENNTYNNPTTAIRAACDGWNGCRFVFRHNTLNNMFWANHGLESGGRPRGARQAEVYENDFTFGAGTNWPSAMGTRGGTGVFFNNRCVELGNGNVDRAVDATNQRNDTGSFNETFWPWAWAGRWTPVSVSSSGTTVTVTSPNRKGFTNFHGYNHSDGSEYVQLVGFTPAAYNGTWAVIGITDTTITFNVNVAPGPVAVMGRCMAPWDNNTNDDGYLCMDQCGAGPGILLTGDVPVPAGGGIGQTNNEPLYLFNNTINGVVSNLVLNGSGSSRVIVDYFDNTMKPGYTSYTYPHPLVGGSSADTTPPSAPTGVSIL